MLDEFHKKGIRISIEAEEALKQLSNSQLHQLLESGKPFLTLEDIEEISKSTRKDMAVEIVRSSSFKPLAKDYSPDVHIEHSKNISQKCQIKGDVQDFVAYFRDRYRKLAKMLSNLRSNYALIDIADGRKHVNEKVRIIAMVYEKRKTKNGNLLLQVEDLSGEFLVIISNNKHNEKLFDKAQNVIIDDIIAISGKMLEPYLIAEEIDWPDMPVARMQKFSARDLATVHISDTHFGSKYFLPKYLDKFVEWVNGKGERADLAGKVKYLVLAGDIVDGVGVYPNQIKELAVPDIYKQYAMFDDFVSRLPDHIEVIVVPGNHDAVRRAEPMPAIDKSMITSDVISLPNPATLSIEGLKHVLYHGTSLDSMIAHIKGMSYSRPEQVMVEYLKRRHLSTIYSGNLIVPQHTDYLALEEEPDVFHCGHVHKNGYGIYRNCLLINSGTFQDRTSFQIRQGHLPTPGVVPVYEMKSGRLHTLDFREGPI